MLGKDEKGYVLSGVGLLLLIPVMIIIPIFLAVETQSSNIPNKMVSSDSVFRSYQDIKNDIRNEVFTFGANIGNKTYTCCDYNKINGNITKLYNQVQANRYQSIFNNNVIITPNYSPQSASGWNYTNGNATLDNGIILSYHSISDLYPNGGICCNYAFSVKTDANIDVGSANGNSGHSQNYAETYTYYFTVNSGQTTNATAINTLNGFFQNIEGYINTNNYCRD